MKTEKSEKVKETHDYYAGMTPKEKADMKKWEREYEKGKIRAINEQYDHLI